MLYIHTNHPNPTALDWSQIDALLDTEAGKKQATKLRAAVTTGVMVNGERLAHTGSELDYASRAHSAEAWFTSLYQNRAAVVSLTQAWRTIQSPSAEHGGQNWDNGGAEAHWAEYWDIRNALVEAKFNVKVALIVLAFINIRARRDAGEVL